MEELKVDIDAKKKTIIILIVIIINVIMVICTAFSVFKSIKKTLNGETKIASEETIDNNEDRPKVKYFSCVDCGICVDKCPNQAIIAARRS